ncbi:hypothetical protein ASZ78_013210, partial [Callipepla squamata]
SYGAEGSQVEMSTQETDALRCWRCRKYIANSVCIAQCYGKEPSDVSIISRHSAVAQESCSVWHVNLEAIPEWIKCVIEKVDIYFSWNGIETSLSGLQIKTACLMNSVGFVSVWAQWTAGKLYCPFCEARLGGFNFICNTKCSCGQLVNIHFCKSRTDYQAACSFRLPKSAGKCLPLCEIKSGFSKGSHPEVVTAVSDISPQELSYITRKNNSDTERFTEALCLEARSPRFVMESKKVASKALNQKGNPFASRPNDACTLKPFHRRSHSLDLSIRERLALSPVLFETSSLGPIYHMKWSNSQNENPSLYTPSDLQLESNSSAFQVQYSSSAGKIQKRFRAFSCTTLVHRDTESDECDFQATGQSSGDAIADGSPFLMSVSSSTSAVEENEYAAPVSLAQSAGISFNRNLSKREKNKLKSMRRKQRRQEQWLQKQVGV